MSRRTPRIALLATVSALAPSAAYGQDASVLLVVGGPPLLLAPFVAALLRRAWLRRTSRSAPSWRRSLALGILEFVLWLAVAWLVGLVYFREAWLAGLLLCGALVAILALHRSLGGGGSWRFWVASAGVFPSVWFLLLLVAWVLVLALG